MRKYLIHFIYLLIIAALAVASRLKTNSLYEELDQLITQNLACQETAIEARDIAEAAQAEAVAANALAEERRLVAERALQDCLNQ